MLLDHPGIDCRYSNQTELREIFYKPSVFSVRKRRVSRQTTRADNSQSGAEQ